MKQIYLHGLGQTPASWEKTIAQLGASPDSVCPDLAEMVRGRDATYRNLFEAFCKICNRFDEKIELCGLSLGGILAMNYAIVHPEKVNALVLIAAQYKTPKALLKFQKALFRFMPESMFQQTGLGKKAFLQLCETMEDLDFGGLLSEIDCPALVICGERDLANKRAAAELAGILKNAELHMIPDSGHEVNVEAPEKLAEALSAFGFRSSTEKC